MMYLLPPPTLPCKQMSTNAAGGTAQSCKYKEGLVASEYICTGTVRYFWSQEMQGKWQCVDAGGSLSIYTEQLHQVRSGTKTGRHNVPAFPWRDALLPCFILQGDGGHQVVVCSIWIPLAGKEVSKCFRSTAPSVSLGWMRVSYA